ncbi:Fe-S cluster assembly ATPase SufC [candidate division WWE3 bacterium RIFOXYC1_FULL_40_10]|uniref:Fe-S cluster assembly ATPase SufC n=1 Tax=candidate division WWE3 bacterium RIFOXYA2_FULL_46_9 TaxID=1802636 RepID=A0A1F4W2B2_UNCKA|nr:MAG: Fe-S cluster assembly ATPase SufC [candidate division WWE3 bacterium RIFOXYB1_FULL_40_22]OGC61283.1 MAG: Fe-S cluster assembly ATPase SufC [candidate division WWE3 bacterium RIFOXYA1_FULL_40_11]OGC63193.1 MAG: Fe-S cluster assembly ATPase SufC [candidate division WWE3 bacterium RIFOXYA2_FULL_46_9]OGC65274.1 MAG: Fe-S cluster assembly ATPase SufC [candidate division WWE3 bacterium RIFOXYB2_FULL_41_6]OGC65666.1 MAG: Fe-S cluster assembly ATPase SufC [candidate division WWE3 bacterium RIFO
MLNIHNLKVKLANKDNEILSGVNLEIKENEIHAIMGRNGSGKSTLAQTIMGSTSYEVTSGDILFNGKSILALSPTEKSLQGIFLSFQHPSEIPGVSILGYLRMIYNKRAAKPLSPIAFKKYIQEKLDLLGIPKEFLNRYFNEGFSGGEKKRMEMLQMLVVEPKLAILDEVDSGLDVDSLKIVSKAVTYLHETTGMAVLLITHYTRILKYIEPDFVHIMDTGIISKTGDKNLAHKIEEVGYEELRS